MARRRGAPAIDSTLGLLPLNSTSSPATAMPPPVIGQRRERQRHVNVSGATPLHAAARHNRSELARFPGRNAMLD